MGTHCCGSVARCLSAPLIFFGGGGTKLSHTLVLGHPQSGNMVVRRDVFKNKRSTKIFRFARLASRNIVHRVAATALLSAVIISLSVLTFFFFPKKKPIFVQRSHVSHSKFSNTIQRKVLQNSSRARTRNPVIDYRVLLSEQNKTHIMTHTPF